MDNMFESQVDKRVRLNNKLVEHSYAELAASVTDPRRAPVITMDDIQQTDGAVKTCLKYLRMEVGTVPDSVRDVDERVDLLCRPSGTMHRKVLLDESWYREAFGAMLGKLDTGEVIALLPHGVRGYYFLEPGTGRKIRVNNSVAQHIQPDAICFYPSLPQRSLTVRDLIAFVFKVFDRSDYLLVVVAALTATVLGLLPAWANKIVFETVAPSGQADLILPMTMLLVGVTVSSVLIEASRNLVMNRVSVKLGIATEAATFSRVLLLPASFFKQYSSGNLATRVSNLSILSLSIAQVLLGTGLTSLLSLVYVFQIGAYAPVLTVPALITVLVEASMTVVVTLLTMRYEWLSMSQQAKISGTETALLNGIQKIKLAGAEDRAFSQWAHDYAKYARVTYNRPAGLRALPALTAVVGIIGTAVIFYFAGVSRVSVANYMAFNVAFGQVTASIMALAEASQQISQIPPTLNMVAPILDASPELAGDKAPVSGLNGSITVSDVSFRYGENSPYVINDLSFRVSPGEYVALVGRSGCGKSTIVRLLLGFEKPERGTIFYGNYDVNKVDLRSLRRHVGTVMQDGRLFLGDMMSNITISTPSATLDDAWRAAEIAGIADDIRKMPMGMQTIVTEGSGGVSGGQRQRLMIARAVCGDRKILILDEATSALDNVTQKHVIDSLDSLQCTRLVVAHRLSTVKHCDRILVVDGGHIAEEGTYDELIAKDGLFAQLVAMQRLD